MDKDNITLYNKMATNTAYCQVLSIGACPILPPSLLPVEKNQKKILIRFSL